MTTYDTPRLLEKPASPLARMNSTQISLLRDRDGGSAAPDVEVAVLALEAVDATEPMSERALRAVAHSANWVEQRTAWSTPPWASMKEAVLERVFRGTMRCSRWLVLFGR
jgi:hypothetical protein